MFPFFLKKTRLNKASVKATLFAGLVSVLLTGLLFVSCEQPTNGDLINAQSPSITDIATDPVGGEWDVSEDEEFTLTVTATSPDGGTLSYQWYENTSNSTTGGTTIGEDNEILTLEKDDYLYNDDYYFYVVVTNTNNSVSGNKTATATSNAVTVTVSGNLVNARPPNITEQPTGGEWDVSEDEEFILTVTATSPDGGTLSYQWYEHTSNSTTGGIEIGEDNETLTLAKTDYAGDGDLYFYVVVTNTISDNNDGGKKTATVTSTVVTVTVSGNGVAMVHAEQPEITDQPTGGAWDVSDTNTASFTLTVTASVTDGGTLSFQWYKNTSNSTTDGTEIGEDDETLTLAKGDYTTDGTYYFYVVVTNTNNAVTGTKTATATSNVATVTVSGNDGTGESELILPAGLSGHFQATELAYYYYGSSFFTDDGFSINDLTFTYYSDSTLETYWRGTIVGHIPQPETGPEPGVLIIQITDVEGTFYTPPEEGKYFAYVYKSLAVPSDGSPTMVNTAAPYKSEGNNTGCDSIEEATSEYADASYYSTMPQYSSRTFTAATLGNLQGKWEMDDMEDYFIIIRGTTYAEFLDDYEDDDSLGVYDPYSEDMLALIGDIVEWTDTTQSSGVLYVRSINADGFFTNGQFIAVGWQNNNDGTIEFATASTGESSLAEVKSKYSSASAFSEGNFFEYTRK